jgi:hypothetical protein
MNYSVYFKFLDGFYKDKEIRKEPFSISNVGVPTAQTSYSNSKSYSIMIGDDLLCKVYKNLLGDNNFCFFTGEVVNNLKLWCGLSDEDAEKVVMEWSKDMIIK